MQNSPPNDRGPRRVIGLRNWRVRSRLIAVLVIPAVAFLVLASFGIGASIRNAQAFDRGNRLAGLSREATALVHELQSERDLSAGFIAGRASGAERDEDRLIAQQRRVDQTASDYRNAEEPLQGDVGQRLEDRFDEVRAGLDDLPELREAVRSGSLTERATFQEYSQTVARLLDINTEIAEPGGDEDLAQQVTAFNDLARVKELTSQVRGTLYAIAVGGGFAFRGFQDFSNLLAERQAALAQFQADASDAQRGQFADVVQGQAVLTVARIQQAVAGSPNQAELGIDPEQWLAASTTEIELLRTVESGLLDGVTDTSQALSSSARRDALRDAVVMAVILAIALLALLLVANSMARPLQKLRAGAMEIAEHRLPDAVQRLRTTETGDLDVRVEPLGIRSKDEIGQVAQAVDAIQQVAVRLATEQAALRRSIGDMFTNMARRSQTLIDRQLELIDDLERNETDPETLEHLFRLDHLATRMRRNAEDLIVLSGADPGRHWVQPMTLVDVARAAAAEVEEYQRVEFLPLADLEVAGHAAVDVIHLLAELIENATAFSPPNTKVQIAGQAVPHGYVLEIEDRGLGMSDEELIQANERLANPPEIDFALSRVLGLYVVGRLGQRHGIKVQLRHSWYGADPASPQRARLAAGVPGDAAAGGGPQPGRAAATGAGAGGRGRARRARGRGRRADPFRRPPADLRGGPLRLVRDRARREGPPAPAPAPARARHRRRRRGHRRASAGSPGTHRAPRPAGARAEAVPAGAGGPPGPTGRRGAADVSARTGQRRRRRAPAPQRAAPATGGRGGATATGARAGRADDPGRPAPAGAPRQPGPGHGGQPAGRRRPATGPAHRPLAGRGP
jgi:HAMP domain-containing protein